MTFVLSIFGGFIPRLRLRLHFDLQATRNRGLKLLVCVMERDFSATSFQWTLLEITPDWSFLFLKSGVTTCINLFFKFVLEWHTWLLIANAHMSTSPGKLIDLFFSLVLNYDLFGVYWRSELEWKPFTILRHLVSKFDSSALLLLWSLVLLIFLKRLGEYLDTSLWLGILLRDFYTGTAQTWLALRRHWDINADVFSFFDWVRQFSLIFLRHLKFN